MSLDFDAYAILLLLAPFALAALAPLISRETGRAAGWVLAIVPAGLFAMLLGNLPDVAAGHPVHLGIDWVPVLGLRLSFFIDGLSLVFALLITGIGAVILVYSGEYLRGHPQRGRLLAFLLLFLGAMLGLVLADSLVALFAFWELTAVTSFLLIGFDHERPAARRAATQALVVTSLGGLALLAGGVTLSLVTGSWDLSAMGSFVPELRFNPAYPWVLGFMLVAAFTKSAQLPFHFWLPGAMEAPTPVSAFLHSATMVQAGIYLLARLLPLLGDTPLWEGLLGGFGSITLLWGALVALRQTDLKQILAQTTIAALGLLMILLGLGGDAAATAVAAYFVAHAFYKAALFLVAGIIDHGTGTRDITRLGGLRDQLTISFIAAALAAISMFGIPPFLGWFAKELAYSSAHLATTWEISLDIVMVLGSAAFGGVALVLLIGPFMGELKPTPEKPHEGNIALWIGPVFFGLLSLAVVFALPAYGDLILSPMAGAILGHSIDAHIGLSFDVTGLPFWLSIVTWALAIAIYLRIERIRVVLATAEARINWSFDRGFDELMFALIRFAGGWTRLFHHGRLELYLVVVFACLSLVLLGPMLADWPAWPSLTGVTLYEWAAIALAVVGISIVVFARSRLIAIVALGVQGLAVALLFLFFGAPDVGFTQLLVETLSVVILALVMTRLRLSTTDSRPLEDWLRDGVLAVIAGGAIAMILLRVVQGTLDGRLSRFFEANAYAVAHGRNIVNVILVDFRGLDTLGEISVVMTAGIAILALLRRQHKQQAAR